MERLLALSQFLIFSFGRIWFPFYLLGIVFYTFVWVPASRNEEQHLRGGTFSDFLLRSAYGSPGSGVLFVFWIAHAFS